MTTPKIMIAFPTHDGRILLAGMGSVLYMIAAMGERGWETVLDFSQSSDIVHSRALIAMRFMESDCTHLLMIDTDLQFEHMAPITMVESGHFLCGGAYPKKKVGEAEFTVSLLDGPPVNGFLRAQYIGAGLMLIRRAVFEKIKRAFPDITGVDPKSGFVFTSYFQSGIIDNLYCSEDAAFCIRWQKCGGTVWVLEDCKFNHYGTYGWGGNLKEFLAMKEQKAKAA